MEERAELGHPHSPSGRKSRTDYGRDDTWTLVCLWAGSINCRIAIGALGRKQAAATRALDVEYSSKVTHSSTSPSMAGTVVPAAAKPPSEYKDNSPRMKRLSTSSCVSPSSFAVSATLSSNKDPSHGMSFDLTTV